MKSTVTIISSLAVYNKNITVITACAINYAHTGLTVDSYLLPTTKSRDTKSSIKIKIPDGKVLGIAP